MTAPDPGADVIVTAGLTKRYGRVVAVRDVDLRVPAGSRFGLLGPNGSGKTTMVRMVLGLVHPTRGTVMLLGEAMPRRAGAVLPRVGALVEGPAAWPHLSGRANLRLLDAAGRSPGISTAGRSARVSPAGRSAGIGTAGRSVARPRRTRRARIEEALERVGLAGVDRRPVRAYSLGMRQRLGLAAALLSGPELLLLDEPTNGLDPRGIGEVRALLRELNAAGTTVVLSSHLLTEVEELCDRVAVMDAGRLVLSAELAELRAPTGRILVRTPDAGATVGLLDGRVEHRDGDRLLVRADDPQALNAQLVTAGIRVAELVAQRRSLEQVVLAATGPGADRLDDPTGGPERVGGPTGPAPGTDVGRFGRAGPPRPGPGVRRSER